MLWTVNSEEIIPAEHLRHFWNPILYQESQVEDYKRMDIGIDRYLLTKQLVMNYFTDSKRNVIYGRTRDLDPSICWGPALCALDERKLHSI